MPVGSRLLADFRTAQATDLSLLSSLVDATADRGLHEAIGEFSLLYPNETTIEFIWRSDNVDEEADLGRTVTEFDETITFDSVGTTYYTVNPIKYRSETITRDSDGKVMERYRDYSIDYLRGAVKATVSGDVAAGNACSIKYTPSRYAINLRRSVQETVGFFDTGTGLLNTGTISGVTRVTRVIDEGREEDISFSLSKDGILTLNYQDVQKLSNHDHLRIDILTEWGVPAGSGVPAPWPAIFDELVVKGAAGFSAKIEMHKQMQSAINAAAGMNTVISKIDDEATVIDDEFTFLHTAMTGTFTTIDANITGTLHSIRGTTGEPLTDAIANLISADSIINHSNVTTALTAINTASDKISAILDSAKTELDASSNSATSQLADDSGEFFTAYASVLASLSEANTDLSTFDDATGEPIYTALDILNTPSKYDNYITGTDSMDAAVDQLADTITDSSGSIQRSLSDIRDLIGSTVEGESMDDILDEIEAILQGGSSSSAASLVQANAASDAALVSAAASGTTLAAGTAALAKVDSQAGVNAGAMLDAGDDFINTVNVGGPNVSSEYRQYALARTQMANAFTSEANSRQTIASGYLSDAQTKARIADGRVQQAREYNEIAKTRLAQANGRYNSILARGTELNGYVQEFNSRKTEAEMRLKTGQAFMDKVGQYMAVADRKFRLLENYIGKARVELELMDKLLGKSSVRLQTAVSLVRIAETRARESQSYINEVNTYIAQGDATRRVAEGQIAASNTLLAEANVNRDRLSLHAQLIQRWLDRIQLRISTGGQYINQAQEFSREVDKRMQIVEVMDREATRRIHEFRRGLENDTQVNRFLSAKNGY